MRCPPVGRVAPADRQSRERRVVARRAAATDRPGVALWQERGCDAAAGSEVANVLADRVTVAASKRSGALALIDRAGARSSPRISSQLDDLRERHEIQGRLPSAPDDAEAALDWAYVVPAGMPAAPASGDAVGEGFAMPVSGNHANVRNTWRHGLPSTFAGI